jgi:hypothetical protein
MQQRRRFAGVLYVDYMHETAILGLLHVDCDFSSLPHFVPETPCRLTLERSEKRIGLVRGAGIYICSTNLFYLNIRNTARCKPYS